MAKVKSKGIIVQHTISASLTAIAQLTSVELSGAESETFDSTTLDGGVYKTYDPTGYSEPGELSVEMFYDPALAGHQFITDMMDAPADNAMKIIFPDTTEQSFTVSGYGVEDSAAMDDGLKRSVTYKIDGDPGWPT